MSFHLIHGSMGHTNPHTPNVISISSTVFVRLALSTNKHINRQRDTLDVYCVAIGRILRYALRWELVIPHSH